MSIHPTARFWAKTHAYVSVFFLPVALFYAVTGGLYILGIHGGSQQQTLEIAVEQPWPEEVGAQQAIVAEQLHDHGLPLPSGSAQSVHGRFLWGSPTRYSVTLQNRGQAGPIQIQANTPSLYSRLVMLHKAKCGAAFKTLGVAFATAMALIYLSGIVMSWRATSMRPALLASLFGGVLAAGAVVFASL